MSGPPVNLSTAQKAAMNAFRALVNAIQTLPDNSSSLKPQLNKTVNVMRILKAAKTANPNAAAAMAAANVPAAPTKKSIVTRAVNSLTAFKTRLTPTRVQAEGNKVANALSFAQKLRRKGGVRAALGQTLKLPELGARGISKVATAVGKGYGNWRAAQLNPVNKNFEATLKRYRNLSKNTSLTSANSNIKWAKALANNNKKNLYISWNPLYTGNRNSANYAQKVLNWSRRKLAADLAANNTLRITIKANNKNLNKFNRPNKVQALAEAATNYATLKRLLGGKNTNVTKFLSGLESKKNTRKQTFDTIVRAAGMNIGLAKVKEEAEAAAAAQKEAANKAARTALLQKLYPGLNYTQVGGNTPFQKAANIRQKFNVRNVRLSNAERALLSQNDLAVYNTAKKLKSIPKVGNKITPRTAAEAQMILNAANLKSILKVNNQPAINAKLISAGINTTKYNFSKIKPLDFKLKQEQLAVTALQTATAAKAAANKVIANKAAAEAAEEAKKADAQKKFNAELKQFNSVKSYAKLGSLNAILGRMASAAKLAGISNTDPKLLTARKNKHEAAIREFIQEIWPMTARGGAPGATNVNRIARKYDINLNADKNIMKTYIPNIPTKNSIIGWRSIMRRPDTNYAAPGGRRDALRGALGLLPPPPPPPLPPLPPPPTRSSALLAPNKRGRPATWTINQKFTNAYAKNNQAASNLYILSNNGKTYRKVNNPATGNFTNTNVYNWNATVKNFTKK